MIDYSQIDFSNPDRSYLFSKFLFLERELFLFLRFDPSLNNLDKRVFIEDVLLRLNDLGRNVSDLISCDESIYKEYFQTLLFEEGWSLDDDMMRSVFGHTERDSVSNLQFRESLFVHQICISTADRSILFDFTPHCDMDQWLVLKIDENGKPLDLLWES